MNKLIISTTATIAMIALILNVGHVYAGSPEQNYSVGFTDGQSDCHSGTANAFNNHPNANHHSQDYINGYNAGYNSCNNFNSVDLGQNANNVNQNNRNEPQTQGSSQSQGFCVTVFSGCSQTSGQSQGLQN